MKRTTNRLFVSPKPPLFDLGQVVATPGAVKAITHLYSVQCLLRHVRGEWGTVCPEDAQSNTDAVTSGDRILSAFPIDPAQPCAGYGDNCLWIITEGDRSVTTILLPSEY